MTSTLKSVLAGVALAVACFWGVDSPASAVEFIHRYGLLTHGPGAADFSEEYREWEEVREHINKIVELGMLDSERHVRRSRCSTGTVVQLGARVSARV